MMNLISAETSRLLSRRMTRFFPAALAALMITGITIAVIVVERNDENGPDFVTDIAQGAADVPGSTLILGPLGFLLPIMAFVIGASYFGADQKAGMIEQLLTWEPRRSRLLGARLVGGMPALFIITALLSAFMVVLLYGLSSISGTTEGAGDIVGMIVGAIFRSALVGALFFAMGLAVTVITNSSVGSIVGFLIYAFVVENLIVAFLDLFAPWMPMTNADAFVSRFGVGRGSLFGEGGFGTGDFHHEWVAAGLIVAGWAALFVAIALVVFGRRDVA